MSIKREEITAGAAGKVGYNAILKSDPGKLNPREIGGEFGLKAVAFLNNQRSIIREATDTIRNHDLNQLRTKIIQQRGVQGDPVKLQGLQDAYRRSSVSFHDPIVVRLEFHSKTDHVLFNSPDADSQPDPNDERVKRALLAFGKEKGIPIYKTKGNQYYLGNKQDLDAVLNFLNVGDKEKGELLLIRERIATTKQAAAANKNAYILERQQQQDETVDGFHNTNVIPDVAESPTTTARKSDHAVPASHPESVFSDIVSSEALVRTKENPIFDTDHALKPDKEWQTQVRRSIKTHSEVEV